MSNLGKSNKCKPIQFEFPEMLQWKWHPRDRFGHDILLNHFQCIKLWFQAQSSPFRKHISYYKFPAENNSVYFMDIFALEPSFRD